MLASVTPQDRDSAGQVSQLEKEVVATVSAVKPQKGLVAPLLLTPTACSW